MTTQTVQETETENEILTSRLKIIRLKQAGIDEASKIVADITERLKEAKKMRESRIHDLGDFIRGGEMPLFEGNKASESASAERVTGDDWKTVRLDSLATPAISPRYLKAMEENTPPIRTLGELADWQSEKGDFWAKDIKGLGETGQDELVNATTAYWDRINNAPLAGDEIDDDDEDMDEIDT